MKLKPGKFSGVICVPPSKSDAQRALLAAGLADGVSRISNLGKSEDELQMLRNVQEIGAQVTSSEGDFLITGTSEFPHNCQINLGESGLGYRLMAGQFAIHGGEHLLAAKGTLQNRPMDFYQKQFEDSGLKVEGTFPPLKMSGKSNKQFFQLDGSEGSQFISGLVMALPLADFDSEIILMNLKSRPYLEMTLQTVHEFGIKVERISKDHFKIKGNQTYQSRNYTIESDWSSASCWLAASALGHDLELQGLALKSLQADKKMLGALISAGCKVQHTEKGIRVDGTQRKPFVFDANDCPDLFPALAVLAAKTEGQSIIYGLNRLKIKESDRGLAIQQEWSKMGVKVELDYANDLLICYGKTDLQPANFVAHHDHRIAMAIGILSSFMPNNSELIGEDSVAKSYPDFWDHMESVRRD